MTAKDNYSCTLTTSSSGNIIGIFKLLLMCYYLAAC